MTALDMTNAPSELRPKNFTDIVGQPYISGLGKQIAKGIVSGQGYIFAGQKGLGKTTGARNVAQALNCESIDKKTGDPCHECKSCILAESGNHPNILEINAAINRGIADANELVKRIRFSVSNGVRVVIIDEAHMLTREAFSVLLKPMEEPPENTIFILTTTDIESIPETIISRSIIIPVLPLNHNDLMKVVDNAVEKGKESNPEWESITQQDKESAVMSASGSARQAITNVSSIIMHGVHSGIGKSHAEKLSKLIDTGNVAGTLSLMMSILTDKENVTSGSSVIDSVINYMIDNIESFPDVASTSLKIAELSRVYSDTKSSSPAVITASRVAHCASLSMPSPSPADSSQVQGFSKKKTKNKNTAVKKQETSPKEEVEVEDDILPDLGDIPQDGGKYLPRNLDDFDKIIGESKMSDKWFDIMTNDDKSDVSVNENTGRVSVTIHKREAGSAATTKLLKELFADVHVAYFDS